MKQLTKVMPASALEDIQIKESFEPLVEIPQTDRIIFRTRQEKYFIRKTILQMLQQASTYLPKENKLVILDGYRTIAEQKRLWDEKIDKLKKDHPEWPLEEIEKKVQIVVALPTKLANHHCGGAVDVTLFDQRGKELNMGPELNENTTSAMYTTFKMFPNTLFKKRINKKQEENRKILRDAMEKAGFVWYPPEWWHYCWGDRMWAAYTNQKECFYGPIEL